MNTTTEHQKVCLGLIVFGVLAVLSAIFPIVAHVLLALLLTAVVLAVLGSVYRIRRRARVGHLPRPRSSHDLTGG